MIKTFSFALSVPALVAMCLINNANAAIGLDRTRVVFDGNKEAVSMSITNNNTQLPYLAQGWIEDEQGNKITSPLIVLPPVQRLEPGKNSQVKVQSLPAVQSLPQDRESVYYFNLREIPPRSEKTNSLQIALQTRIKLFYRPAALVQSRQERSAPWQEELTLTLVGDQYQVNNPTPYYVTLIDARRSKEAETVTGFEPLMLSPKESLKLGGSVAALGTKPRLTYVNDYGGRPPLVFSCEGNTCKVDVAASSVNE